MALFGRLIAGWKDGRAPVAEIDEEAEQEPPINGERLQRYTDRFKSAPSQAESASGTAAAGQTAAALPDWLRRNAFALLDVPLDASAERISDAYDTLSFEPGHDPQALDEARAKIMSARDRLTQELCWLPESSSDNQASVRAALRAGDVAEMARLRDATKGLARINLAMAVATARPDAGDEMVGIFLDVKAWDADGTLDALDEARGRGRFRPVDVEQWDGAIRNRIDTIAAFVASEFARSADSRSKLVRLMQQTKDLGGAKASFLDAVMRHYVAGIDETLGRLSGRINDCVAKLRERPHERAHATALLSSLELWSSYRLPIQVMEAARALDDPASAEIMKTIRDLSVTLTNEFKQYETALLLVRGLLHCFTQVPSCRHAAERDLPILIQNALVKRLQDVCDRIYLRDTQFSNDVQGGGLGQGARGLARELAGIMDDALDKWTEDPAPLFIIVRELSVRMHNELGRHDVTPVLLQWLLSLDPPIAVAAKLREDLKGLGGRR